MRQSTPGSPTRAIGLMSGTSADGVDVAWLASDGLSIAETGPFESYPFEDGERARILAAMGDAAPGPDAVRAVTEAHARAVEAFLSAHPDLRGRTDVIGFHGQTTFHDPENHRTVQIGDAEALAGATGLPVVHDFRSADVAAGGQGAPLAPLYHVALAEGLTQPLAVLNLGGVGNVTWIGPQAPPMAFDTGPANALIDDWMAAGSGERFDADGQTAASGRVDRSRLDAWLGHSYFGRKPPKSLDRNDFTASVDGMSLTDGAATLAAFTVESVALALVHMPAPPVRWLVTGGGRHNRHIMSELAQRLGAPVAPVEAVGWNGDALEAQAFAFLAVRSLRGLPLSLPSTTGVPRPMPGGRLVQPTGSASERRPSTYLPTSPSTSSSSFS
ncbi:MAG: anhydro-N-acetylmuramic acid kinase [Rhizobiales bacterium NRL2]|jgi:anhydro-N-acetylmuramic acid kinase|nr:MAG: anhydro-N-acetylmuramic acid kinase [Rhizobiales bacterium NRL2]